MEAGGSLATRWYALGMTDALVAEDSFPGRRRQVGERGQFHSNDVAGAVTENTLIFASLLVAGGMRVEKAVLGFVDHLLRPKFQAKRAWSEKFARINSSPKHLLRALGPLLKAPLGSRSEKPVGLLPRQGFVLRGLHSLGPLCNGVRARVF